MIKDKIELSEEFKKQVNKAIISIILFIFVYCLIFTLAIGITVASVVIGIGVIAILPGIITLGLGIGLSSFGIFITIFLVKFLFTSHKNDRSKLIEITAEDQAEFFAIINDITTQVGTEPPKKIYLSHDVNASVFYDSSFWSMFFPVKKNLSIGLGLINTISAEELKAILAHEFGHFSQKSMKIGSFVYNVNHVIYNMLFDNESFSQKMYSWASVLGIFSFFVSLSIKFIEGIQWILRQVYLVVNKNYSALSREMEFHADEIASHVTGYKPLKTSLLRMELATFSFDRVLAVYESKISENVKSLNFYNEHKYTFHFHAKQSKLPYENILPQVSLEHINKFNKSKLNIKDQWASHPSVEERIAKLEEKKISIQGSDLRLANSLFKNLEQIQIAQTEKMYSDISYEEQPKVYTLEDFQKEYETEYEKNTFSELYNDYYDNKNPTLFDWESITDKNESFSIEDLFSDKKIEQVYSLLSLENDIETVKHIIDKTLLIKSFDYNGKKYKQKESRSLLKLMEKELEGLQEKIKQHDLNIFLYFKSLEVPQESGKKLSEYYKEFFAYDKVFDQKYELYNKLNLDLEFINHTTPVEIIRANFNQLKPLEKELKAYIEELLKNPSYEEEITEEIKSNFETYLSKEWEYFGNEKYFDDPLNTLFTAINNFAFLNSITFFNIKKSLLVYQESLLENRKN